MCWKHFLPFIVIFSFLHSKHQPIWDMKQGILEDPLISTMVYFTPNKRLKYSMICICIHGMHVGMWGHYGFSFVGVLSRPFNEAQTQISITFGGINFLSTEDCAPFIYLGSWALVLPYFYFRFCIFNKLVLEEYVSQVEGGPHLFLSCLHTTQNDLILATKEMHPSFESLVVINTPSLHASLMDIHHDTSLGFILEDDSISLASRICIRFCSAKGIKLWLVVRPLIYLFHIAHYTFTSTLRFHLGLIQPSTSNLFTCECGHGLDTFGTYLIRCPFGSQWITTHDAI